LHLLRRKSDVVGQAPESVERVEETLNQPAKAPAPTEQRSGSATQLDRSFRRVTAVGGHPLTLRRSGSLLRPA
jgi:hypothetical protein